MLRPHRRKRFPFPAIRFAGYKFSFSLAKKNENRKGHLQNVYITLYIASMSTLKPVQFIGSSLDDLRDFPLTAKREAGYPIDQVQEGLEPDDWKPMNTVGQGVKEIRIRDASGAFRVIYVAKFADAIYVLHCFQKKTEKTSKESGSRLGFETLSRLIAGVETMSNEKFTSIWDAIEDTPEEAENMKLRSTLMMAIKNHITETGISQVEAAKLLGVTQPRISDLMRGKINLFGLDALVNMATAAGLHIEMRISEAA